MTAEEINSIEFILVTSHVSVAQFTYVRTISDNE